MDKIAQRRGILSKIKEKANVPGKLMEFFSPQFQELMDILREVDDHVRIEAKDLNDYLKVAKTNFNRREYMTSIAYLGRFYDRVEAIDNELSKLSNTVDTMHNEFLFGGEVDPEHVTYLTQHLGPKIEKKKTANEPSSSLEKEAGITDWWHNITSDRGRTLAAWEKRFPKYVKEIKTQTNNMINKSEMLLKFLLATLKMLAALRAGRKLEEYLKTASKFREKFRQYSALFGHFYNTQVKKFIDYQKSLETMLPKMSPEEQAKMLAAPLADAGKKPESIPTAPTSAPAIPSQPLEVSPSPFPKPAVSPAATSVPILPSIERDPFDTMISPPPVHEPDPVNLASPVIPRPPLLPKDMMSSIPATPASKKKANHQLFLKALSSLDDKHPFVKAKEIIIYAKSIKNEEPEISAQLMALAHNILQK